MQNILNNKLSDFSKKKQVIFKIKIFSKKSQIRLPEPKKKCLSQVSEKFQVLWDTVKDLWDSNKREIFIKKF